MAQDQLGKKNALQIQIIVLWILYQKMDSIGQEDGDL